MSVEFIDLDFVVEVTDVCDHGLIFHLGHMLDCDDIQISRGGDVNIRSSKSVLDGCDLKSLHSGLESIDRIDFGHDHAGSLASQGLGGAFSNIAISAHHGHFAGYHDIQGAVQSVDKGVTTTVKIIELRLGD